MKTSPDNLRSKANAGFSLVDVMVGMVIALLGTIIIFQVFSVSEGIKRTTTSGGDATQSGGMALSTLEMSLKQAGYGFFRVANGATPATVLGAPPVSGVSYAPVWITPGAANASDAIAISYRQFGTQAAALPAAPCTPTAPPAGWASWDNGSFVPPDNGTNPSFPLTIPPPLTVETISVITNAAGQAQLCSNVNGIIADGVVLLKTEYGVDLVGNGIVTQWNQVAPANPMSVLAVRLAVVTRSAQPEVTRNAAGQTIACATTTATTAPVWIDSANLPLDLSGNVGLAAGDDWKCYRYKTFETIVPLRNLM